MTQSSARLDHSTQQRVAFVIGSGNHAFGYLVRAGDHLFQSPLSYYAKRGAWDMAPGYEHDPRPDFLRPITAECLFCHSGRALPVENTLNTYEPRVFDTYGISCDRCHGDTSAHLKTPVPGSILNPAKLKGAARDSICEQCHQSGEARIPNPGKSITDFRPGQVLEDFYTTYVVAQAPGHSIKVVSHAEQLSLSQCARRSGERLWCGTCHDPHNKPLQPATYFRERCLSCHASTLDTSHAAPGRDCVACHMPKVPANDGGHTAFTNHRIARTFSPAVDSAEADTLAAWREPATYLRDRNLALALVNVGLQKQSSAEVIRGYQMLNRLISDFPNDPALLTTLGSVLMKAGEANEAVKYFSRVIALKHDYAPYYVNAATALIAAKRTAEARKQLQNAVTLDALLPQAMQLLSQVYREQGESEKADELVVKYNQALGITPH